MREVQVFRAKRYSFVLPVVGYAMCAYFFIAWLHDPTGPKWWWLLLLVELVFLSASSIGAVLACARATVGESGIEFRCPGWRRSMAWKDVVSYKLSGKLNSTGTLRDRNGKQLDLDYSLFGNGLILAQIVEAKTGTGVAPDTGENLELPGRDTGENLELPVRARSTARGLLVGLAGALALFGLMPLLLLLRPMQPGDLEFMLVLSAFGWLCSLVFLYNAFLEVVLYGDRIEHRLPGWTRTIQLADIRQLIVSEPGRRPGVRRLPGKLAFQLDRRSIVWTLPGIGATTLVRKLRELVPKGRFVLDRSQLDRTDAKARVQLAAKSIHEPQTFRHAGATQGVVLALMYGIPMLGLLAWAAYSVRDVAGYERLSTSTLVGGALAAAYIGIGLVSFATTLATVSPASVRVQTLFRTREAPWFEIKGATLIGLTTSPRAAVLRTSHGTLKLAGFDRQWALNDLIVAHARAHGIPVEDKTRPDLPA